jgi:oligoendopeptidase F
MKQEKAGAIPLRSETAESDKWNLEKLYASEADWEAAFARFSERAAAIEGFRGHLGESAERFASCLETMKADSMELERLGTYAHLRMAEDAGNDESQKRFALYAGLAARYETSSSFFTPELQAIPEKRIESFLADPRVSPFSIMLDKILRFRPHILSEPEEKLLAMAGESERTPSKTFGALTDVDFDFGVVETPEGPRPLSQASLASFLLSPDRETRRRAYGQFYGVFHSHRNTLASLYEGSIHQDVYKARARRFPSARAAALFPDKVPEEVYDNLVSEVRAAFPTLHRYYALRKKVLGLPELRHYDVYVPLAAGVTTRYSYDEAVEIIAEAVRPLGSDYRDTLIHGLLSGWVDRYENRGKRSGAFSSGAYGADPYILMNYKEDVLRDLFTLIHEGGHSMHSFLSMRNNPFQHYEYTIFEAEVASTFNEQLLVDCLLKRADSRNLRAYLVGKATDDVIATIVRQTMFAEFEHRCHRIVEERQPLSTEVFRAEYRKLLEAYFGPEMVLEEESDMEGLRIPHFYRAYYVYKYATGLSAAITLAEKVLHGGADERDRYLAFLSSGGSRYPIESLALAGVDMSSPEPVRTALGKFSAMVDELETLLTE